ncbi:unnamed protein product [Didymodactylos carnosus]|uniref:Transmembrane protein 196 n=1 Tax=Didymodactylos carnosus TaxID=1234261 RepID=A0A813U1R3_9BILA|nr:unnamed protein product [Didymodactylos carnosus]CAF0929235.1 unnamed protein product [Didymodactylos carnosus]CAF3609029.1 unnamed protein product [Didymodactylos carnosus]CAF3706094.1 unnamed protein product [Didymodactylos carnosus]
MYIVIGLTYAVSSLHIFLALMSLVVGIISASKALVWMAHSVSPIWSGVFFAICGSIGVISGKQKGLYLVSQILCFCAISIVALIVASVNIQLLRLGLINVTTDGHTYQKEEKDVIVLIALTLSCVECLVCLLSILIGVKLAFDAKNQKFRKKEGAFFVQILSEKDIVVVSKAPSSRHSIAWNGSARSSSS